MTGLNKLRWVELKQILTKMGGAKNKFFQRWVELKLILIKMGGAQTNSYKDGWS
jgi:hypothetical protein